MLTNDNEEESTALLCAPTSKNNNVVSDDDNKRINSDMMNIKKKQVHDRLRNQYTVEYRRNGNVTFEQQQLQQSKNLMPKNQEQNQKVKSDIDEVEVANSKANHESIGVNVIHIKGESGLKRKFWSTAVNYHSSKLARNTKNATEDPNSTLPTHSDNNVLTMSSSSRDVNNELNNLNRTAATTNTITAALVAKKQNKKKVTGPTDRLNNPNSSPDDSGANSPPSSNEADGTGSDNSKPHKILKQSLGPTIPTEVQNGNNDNKVPVMIQKESSSKNKTSSSNDSDNKEFLSSYLQKQNKQVTNLQNNEAVPSESEISKGAKSVRKRLTVTLTETEKQVANELACISGNNNTTSNEKEKPSTADSTTDPSKKHKCDLCDCVFTRLSNLKAHVRKHSGEMPYACTSRGCDKRFKWKSSLSSHLKTHEIREASRPDALPPYYQHRIDMEMSGHPPLTHHHLEDGDVQDKNPLRGYPYPMSPRLDGFIEGSYPVPPSYGTPPFFEAYPPHVRAAFLNSAAATTTTAAAYGYPGGYPGYPGYGVSYEQLKQDYHILRQKLEAQYMEEAASFYECEGLSGHNYHPYGPYADPFLASQYAGQYGYDMMDYMTRPGGEIYSNGHFPFHPFMGCYDVVPAEDNRVETKARVVDAADAAKVAKDRKNSNDSDHDCDEKTNGIKKTPVLAEPPVARNIFSPMTPEVVLKMQQQQQQQQLHHHYHHQHHGYPGHVGKVDCTAMELPREYTVDGFRKHRHHAMGFPPSHRSKGGPEGIDGELEKEPLYQQQPQDGIEMEQARKHRSNFLAGRNGSIPSSPMGRETGAATAGMFSSGYGPGVSGGLGADRPPRPPMGYYGHEYPARSPLPMSPPFPYSAMQTVPKSKNNEKAEMRNTRPY